MSPSARPSLLADSRPPHQDDSSEREVRTKTMVKVIYAPPHRDAPFTHHSMPGYGPRIGQETRLTLWMAKQPPARVILGVVGLSMAICAIPQTFFPNKLPWTMSPEYKAANRAYMRYHNMNPIFGVSSKKPGLDH